MSMHSRHKSSALYLSTTGKGVFHRLSLLFFVSASIGLLILGKVEISAVEKVRTTIIDKTLPVLDFLSRPLDSVINIGSTISELMVIREQNNLLRQENERLKRGYMTSMQIEVENLHLRNLLGFVKESNTHFISARIVGDTSGPFLRSAIINAGAEQRVRKGQAVVNDKGLVGRIIEVGERSARLLLITDINSRIPIITGESRERGILSGDNTETPRIMYLPEDTKVKVGEVIMTSGDGDIFPANQPIGIVYYKDKDKVVVKPFVEWSRLEYVSVMDY